MNLLVLVLVNAGTLRGKTHGYRLNFRRNAIQVLQRNLSAPYSGVRCKAEVENDAETPKIQLNSECGSCRRHHVRYLKIFELYNSAAHGYNPGIGDPCCTTQKSNIFHHFLTSDAFDPTFYHIAGRGLRLAIGEPPTSQHPHRSDLARGFRACLASPALSLPFFSQAAQVSTRRSVS